MTSGIQTTLHDMERSWKSILSDFFISQKAIKIEDFNGVDIIVEE